jgi:hypothetical protein
MYKVEIDFDEASRLWRQNKIRVGSMYYYRCSHDKCKRKAIINPLLKFFLCKWHSGIFYKSSNK